MKKSYLTLALLVTIILGLSLCFKIVSAQVNNNNDIRLVVLLRSNGSGNVTSTDGKIDCGGGKSNCSANYQIGQEVTLKATTSAGSVFRGWSDSYDNSNINSPYLQDTFTSKISNLYNGNQIIYAKFISTTEVVLPPVDQADRKIPRVMFWWGKVNQHWDLETGTWLTDPGGVFGARENKLEYCQKFYPTTYKVVAYKNETTNTWKDAGNLGNYTTTKMSYRCVLKGETVEGEDASDLPEHPNSGSVCYYFPDSPLCVPFAKKIKYGESSEDVQRLQKFLNMHGYTVSSQGPGSPGKETKYFGKTTQKALIKFQKDNNLVADGKIGPKTIKVLNNFTKSVKTVN